VILATPERSTGPRGRFFYAQNQLQQQICAPALNRCCGFDHEQARTTSMMCHHKKHNTLINIHFLWPTQITDSWHTACTIFIKEKAGIDTRTAVTADQASHY
jgi:hypothetical protein